MSETHAALIAELRRIIDWGAANTLKIQHAAALAEAADALEAADAERAQLREALEAVRPMAVAFARTSHFLDGFNRGPATREDGILAKVEAALKGDQS